VTQHKLNNSLTLDTVSCNGITNATSLHASSSSYKYCRPGGYEMSKPINTRQLCTGVPCHQCTLYMWRNN